MPGEYYRDAFFIALAGSALLIGIRRLLDVVLSYIPVLHRGVPTAFGASYDAVHPAAAILGGAIVLGLLVTGVLALASGFLGAELRVRWLRLFLFLALAVGLVSNWGNTADFVRQFIANVVLLGFVVSGIRHVARFNLLGWFLVVACTTILSGALELLGQPASFYKMNGYFALACVVGLLAWPLVSWRLAGSADGAKVSA